MVKAELGSFFSPTSALTIFCSLFPGQDAMPAHSGTTFLNFLLLVCIFCPFSWGLSSQDLVPVTAGPLGVGANATLLPAVRFCLFTTNEGL